MIKALLLTLALGFSSCDAMDFATPEQREGIAAYDAILTQKNAALDALEVDVSELQGLLTAALKSGDTVRMGELQLAFQALLSEYETLEASRAETSAEQQLLLDEIMKTPQKNLFTFGSMNIPDGPWKYFALSALSVGSRLFLKRGRRHLGAAVKNGTKLQLGAMIGNIANSLGYGSGSPDMATASARDAAERDNDPELQAALADVLHRRAEGSRKLGAPVKGIPANATLLQREVVPAVAADPQ